MKKSIIALLFLLILCGCQSFHNSTIPWKSEYLEGHILEQKSDTIMNWYSFHKNGLVAATIGDKKGLMAAPLWYWKIDEQGRLVIFDDEKHDQGILLLVSKSSDEIHTKTPQGLDVIFKYTKK